jgi:uncharacterized protein
MKKYSPVPQFTTVQIRIFGALNDFIAPERRHLTMVHTVKGRPSVKDTIEALGVPHPEVGAIFAGKSPVNLSYQLQEGDSIRVYPLGRWLRGARQKILRPTLRGQPRFVLDSHLGKLSHHLRLLGFDTIYQKIFPDSEIVRVGVQERRIILTRDIGLLKNRRIIHAAWIRSADPQGQLKEVITKFQLARRICPLTLCLECNGKIRRVAKKKIATQLPPFTKLYYKRFYLCRSCKKIYWQGAHYQQLTKIIRKSGYIGRLV